ncbi:MAG: hypothetical protein JSR21_04475 [Proteobacteria bacterium]|nr:hypothetical protein [Pseudomonadota bacterium]
MALPRIGRGHVRDAISDHLTRYPDARDTLRGIAAWCEAILGVLPAEDLVKDVVDSMEAEGILDGIRLPDGTKVYGAPRTA